MIAKLPSETSKTQRRDVDSLVIWQWSETAQKAIIRQDNVHSCRNFDKVVEWAEEHELQGHFDDTVHIVDDIEIDNFRI